MYMNEMEDHTTHVQMHPRFLFSVHPRFLTKRSSIALESGGLGSHYHSNNPSMEGASSRDDGGGQQALRIITGTPAVHRTLTA